MIVRRPSSFVASLVVACRLARRIVLSYRTPRWFVPFRHIGMHTYAVPRTVQAQTLHGVPLVDDVVSAFDSRRQNGSI
jgi:hypothetical protein